jgi:CheY-like chemotaxis protein
MTIEESDFSLPELVGDVMRMQEEAARQKGLELSQESDTNLPQSVCGDSLRLRQILLNFVGNAIKFSDHGRIQIRTRLVEEDRHSILLRLDVCDQGIGLSPEQMTRLFTPFTQIDGSLTRKYGGSGLGLVISRRIARLMGGEVGVESEQGKGSCFWTTVRLKRGTVSKGAAVIPGSGDARDILLRDFGGARILVVEDEPSNREVAEFLLLDAGLVPDLAADGREALDRVRNGPYSMILMDLQMPVMNGLDAARAIRQLPGMSRIPIVALTANVFDVDRKGSLAAGMNDYLGKPVLPEALYACVLNWLREAQRSPD